MVRVRVRAVTEAHDPSAAAHRADLKSGGLLESAPDAIVIVDRAGCITLVNAQMEALFGYGRDDVLGHPVEVLLPERLREAHLAHRAAFVADPRTRPMGVGLELAGRRKDGTEFPIEISLSPFQTDGEILVISVIRDISERKRVEQRFRGLLESAPDAIVIADRAGRIALVNTQTERLFGYERADLLGQPVEILLPKRLWALHATHRASYVADPHTRPMGVGLELFGRRRDGSEFPVEISLSPLETDEGLLETDEGLLVTSVIRDISDRKRAEEERAHLLLREQAARAEAELERARLQAILASATHGIVFVDAESGHVTANPEANRLLDWALAMATDPARYAGQIRRPDGRPLTLEELPSSRALRGQIVPDEELLIVRPGREDIPVLVSAAPVGGPGGLTSGAVVVLQDITARKELEQLREEWASVIAHDLRQPVTAITANVSLLDLMLRRRADQHGEGEAIAHILTAALNLDKMIGDLRDLSSLDARRLRLAPQPVDLPALARDIVERTAELTRGHPVRVYAPAALPPVWADPGRIEQVLGNLLTNAAKHGDPTTEIRVHVTGSDSVAEVAVTNSGPGISPEDIDRVFSRFRRARQAERVDGLGLGLYIARGLVQAHGGRIWAESTPGQTTTFRFTLPLAQGQQPGIAGDQA